MKNNLDNMDISDELKSIIRENNNNIDSAYWAEYMRKDGTITRDQYDAILDAMEQYGESDFSTVYFYNRFKSKKQAEQYRLSMVVQYLQDKKYSYFETHIPEYYMRQIANDFSEELKRRGYDGILQSLYGDEIVAFEPEQIKLTTNKAPTSNPDIRYSLPAENTNTSYAPTFYSHMGKVVDGIKSEKIGAGGVVSYLKGKGVKDDEIKWSGIEAFLGGKKSVTKAELQEFVAGSMLQITEKAFTERDYDEYMEWAENDAVRVYEIDDDEVCVQSNDDRYTFYRNEDGEWESPDDYDEETYQMTEEQEKAAQEVREYHAGKGIKGASVLRRRRAKDGGVSINDARMERLAEDKGASQL